MQEKFLPFGNNYNLINKLYLSEFLIAVCINKPNSLK